MQIIKERKIPRGRRVHVPVNDIPGRNSLTIKPESCILERDKSEPKDDGRTKEPTIVKESSIQEEQSVHPQPESKDVTRIGTKPRRSRKSRTKIK